MNKIGLIFFLMLINAVCFSQNKGVISGVIKTKSKATERKKTIVISSINEPFYSDNNGKFKTDSIPYGDYEVTFYNLGFKILYFQY